MIETVLRSLVARLANLIRTHQPCVVLTGAGISTESGIPDFRSPTGIWAKYDPMEYATISAFRRDPVKVWEFYALRFRALTEAQPNAGHLALAELERRGLVRAVVTQNIDGLHERAGSQEVVEVHGSIRTASCLACGQQVLLADPNNVDALAGLARAAKLSGNNALAGTYLAACTVFAALTGRSPVGNPYHAGIDAPASWMTILPGGAQ